MSEPIEIMEGAEDEGSSKLLCRGCLTEWGEMKNMFEWGLEVDFFKYTDIPCQPSDGLPALLCSECEESLNKMKSFVERCQRSDKILKRNLSMESKVKQNGNRYQVLSVLEKNKLILVITSSDPDDKINLPCPFDDCCVQFTKKIHLSYHLAKAHHLTADFQIEQQYYCTVEGCIYNFNTTPNKFFSGRKFLNQHFNKSHKDKNYACPNCKKRFPLQTDLYRHLRTCNLIYTCTICKKQYTNNESYLVHLKRRHPQIHAKYKQEKKLTKHNHISETVNSNLTKNTLSIKRKKSNVIKEPRRLQSVERTDIVKEAIDFIDDPNNFEIRCDAESEESVPLNGGPWGKAMFGITLPTIQVKENPNNSGETVIIQDPKAVVMAEEAADQSIPVENINAEYNVENIKQESLTEEVIVEDFGVPIVEENIVSELHTPCFAEEYAVQECQEDATVGGLKRSSGTQMPECIPNDETLSSWTTKIDFEMQTDGISTQTVLDEILSLKSQNGEDEVFFSGSVSDTQTQTFASEFALNRCNKETQYSMSLTTQDLSFKETQTCVCFCLSSRPNCRHFDGISGNYGCCNVISAETQTVDSRGLINSDVMFSCSSAETQTCFDASNDSM